MIGKIIRIQTQFWLFVSSMTIYDIKLKCLYIVESYQHTGDEIYLVLIDKYVQSGRVLLRGHIEVV